MRELSKGTKKRELETEREKERDRFNQKNYNVN